MRITRAQLRSLIREAIELDEKKRPKPKVTLWDAIRAKRARGEKPAAPGEGGYPDERTWKSATNEVDKDIREKE